MLKVTLEPIYYKGTTEQFCGEKSEDLYIFSTNIALNRHGMSNFNF